MTLDDLAQLLKDNLAAFIPILSALMLVAGILINRHFGRFDQKNKRDTERIEARIDALRKLIHDVYNFEAKALHAQKRWSVYLSYYDSKIPGADDIRQEYFQLKADLESMRYSLMAEAELYDGPSEVNKPDSPSLSAFIDGWATAMIERTSDRDSSSSNLKQVKGIVEKLKALKDHETKAAEAAAEGKKLKKPKGAKGNPELPNGSLRDHLAQSSEAKASKPDQLEDRA